MLSWRVDLYPPLWFSDGVPQMRKRSRVRYAYRGAQIFGGDGRQNVIAGCQGGVRKKQSINENRIMCWIISARITTYVQLTVICWAKRAIKEGISRLLRVLQQDAFSRNFARSCVLIASSSHTRNCRWRLYHCFCLRNTELPSWYLKKEREI